MKIHQVIFKGLTTGFILQLAIGPVFLYVFNLALQQGFLTALASVAGITLADYLYICLSLAGAGKALQNPRYRLLFTIISSAVLIIFGLSMAYQGLFSNPVAAQALTASRTAGAFTTGLLLTLSSPLTIVFWTGVFTARSIEFQLNFRQQMLFGLSAGLPTFLFLGAMAFGTAAFHWLIPPLLVRVLNGLVGLTLILFGVYRLYAGLRKRAEQTGTDQTI